eukprot:scaffold18641_cov89-Skeletonema_dohrnii-CCMP3373.AAC.1
MCGCGDANAKAFRGVISSVRRSRSLSRNFIMGVLHSWYLIVLRSTEVAVLTLGVQTSSYVPTSLGASITIM